MQNSRGFTLIELLVVVAIIGLLGSIIMVSLSGARSKSRDAKRQADIENIRLALSNYYNDYEMYPKNIYSTSGTAPGNGLAPTYLPTVPTDPNSSAVCTSSGGSGCYKYVSYDSLSSCNRPNRYHLGSAMEEPSGSWVLKDVDADTGGVYVYTGLTACTTDVTGAAVFNGNASACTGATAMTSPLDGCFDVAP